MTNCKKNDVVKERVMLGSRVIIIKSRNHKISGDEKENKQP